MTLKGNVLVNLKPGIFADPQAAHPHVGEQHLTARVGNEVTLLGCHGQLQTGGVTPIHQLISQEFHGHLLIVLVGLVQQLIGQLAKFSVREGDREMRKTKQQEKKR